MRAISTVVDVTIFLLFVSAAVATLTLAPDPDPGPETAVVDDQAALLAATTADTEYTVRMSERTAHGTVASLLARGAVANATIDGRPLSTAEDDFLGEITTATRRTLGPSNRTQVLVRWEPYRDAPVRGALDVGPDPPRGRDVTVATISVPAPVAPDISRDGEFGTAHGFDGVASVAARATADALLPAGHATLPSGRVSPASAVGSARLGTLADATGVSVDRLLARGNVSAARKRAVEGLAARYERDMRRRFDTPGRAADAVSAGTVRITLRRWES
jgi:hypothetical protein